MINLPGFPAMAVILKDPPETSWFFRRASRRSTASPGLDCIINLCMYLGSLGLFEGSSCATTSRMRNLIGSEQSASCFAREAAAGWSPCKKASCIFSSASALSTGVLPIIIPVGPRVTIPLPILFSKSLTTVESSC